MDNLSDWIINTHPAVKRHSLSEAENMSSSTTRVFVKPVDENGVERDCLAVPVEDERQTVVEFKRELLKRLKFPAGENCDSGYELRLSRNGVLLEDSDPVGALLRNDEFVTICKWSSEGL